MRSSAVKLAMRALCALMSVFLGLSLATPAGLMLCLGADGHLAIEVAAGDEACQGCDDGAAPGSTRTGTATDRPSMQRVASCACVDLRIGAGTHQVRGTGRPALPSQTLRDTVWASPATDLTVASSGLIARRARPDGALRPPPDLRRAATTVLVV